MKRPLTTLALLIVQTSTALAWGSPPPPTPPPTSTPCTVTITSADQVYYPGKGPLKFVAEVSGSAWNCTASSVQWSSTFYSSNGGANSGVSQPWQEFNSGYSSNYSVATLQSPWIFPSRSFWNDYQTVTATLNGSSDTVKIIGDNVAPGEDFAHALTPVKNFATGKYDTLPFWYFLEQARKNPSATSEFQRFQYESEYQDHRYSWYSNGFYNLTDGVMFDPYGAINKRDNYLSVTPPNVARGDLVAANLNQPNSFESTENNILAAQGTQTCTSGDCIGTGGIFLGFQDRSSLWSFGASTDITQAWQHAAIKRQSNRFTEAPGLGIPVRTAFWQSVTQRYHRRQAYLDVPFGGGEQAAAWAEKQDKKPYSLLIFDVAPRWSNRGRDTAYKGFYCSLLVWAAWYHGAGVNIVESRYSGWWGYLLPGILWDAQKEGKVILRADMRDLP